MLQFMTLGGSGSVRGVNIEASMTGGIVRRHSPSAVCFHEQQGTRGVLEGPEVAVPEVDDAL